MDMQCACTCTRHLELPHLRRLALGQPYAISIYRNAIQDLEDPQGVDLCCEKGLIEIMKVSSVHTATMDLHHGSSWVPIHANM